MKKKILFVINTMGRAGAERALIALMNALPPEKYDISLLSLINRGEMFLQVPNHIHVINKKPDPRSVLNTGGKIALIKTVLTCFFYKGKGFLLIPYLIKNFMAQIKAKKIQPDKLLWRILAQGTPAPKETYDLAVAYLEGASTYFVADSVHAAKKASFIHIDYQKAGYTTALDKDAYQKIDRIFSVSKEAGESFLRLYPQYQEKLRLFRNLLNVAEIQKESRKPLPPEDPFAQSQASYQLLTVGRLNYQKAYDIAIPTLKILREKGLDVDWFVLGEGSLKKELQKQIAKEGLQGHFVLLGTKQNPYPYYKNATLYVHATRYEGKSIAIEEAQILHKAIIASDCTGNREQITHNQNGYLLHLTPESLADGIAHLLLHPEKRKAFEKASGDVNLKHPKDLDGFLELLKP